MRKEEIKQLLTVITVIRDIASNYEDTELADINAYIWEHILKLLNVGGSLEDNEKYYEVFVGFECGLYDIDTFFTKIEGLVKKIH